MLHPFLDPLPFHNQVACKGHLHLMVNSPDLLLNDLVDIQDRCHPHSLNTMEATLSHWVSLQGHHHLERCCPQGRQHLHPLECMHQILISPPCHLQDIHLCNKVDTQEDHHPCVPQATTHPMGLPLHPTRDTKATLASNRTLLARLDSHTTIKITFSAFMLVLVANISHRRPPFINNQAHGAFAPSPAPEFPIANRRIRADRKFNSPSKQDIDFWETRTSFVVSTHSFRQCSRFQRHWSFSATLPGPSQRSPAGVSPRAHRSGDLCDRWSRGQLGSRLKG